jgi:8-oxo-dGTP pyrophosphatase MutT (NUDIX family)
MTKRKAKSMARKGKAIRQVGVLAYRRGAGGAVEILLVTSRRTKRFIIPKGWQMKGKSDPRSAGKEALQEAGIVGRPGRIPIGEYRYWKRLRSAFVPITVTVFPMEVAEVLTDWRERRQRQRAWMRPDEAAVLVDEPALSTMLLAAPDALAAGETR